MSEKVVAKLVVQNRRGLHARAAAAFVNCIADMDVEVLVEKEGQEVDGSSILGLMMLAASKGSEITITASGSEAERAIKELTDLVNSLFGEEQ